MFILFLAIFAAVVGYLFGSLPTGYLIGKALRGIDLRDYGSNSTGATNALRVLGVWPAVGVLLIDVLKGFAPVFIVAWLCNNPSLQKSSVWFHDAPHLGPWIICVAGLAAIIGHGRSLWLNFSGGKSAATGLGVLLGMSWPIGIACIIAFCLVVAASKIVSLSSMLAAIVGTLTVLWLEQPLAFRLLVIAGAAYVILRHRANIQRLLAGTEPRIGRTFSK
ncbi:glycerol-3-phosphate 1-O-acyltransferase PlsY [Agrobacterium larrymoorei]|uniref:Glycerol-3-phosphate acyltransferase n=1 Tax=Agrobacterium larrymoorei TaxID=160699 RepID=A0A4D7DMP2_9HYPH|nr:glycerol-3-phosphate 1-O-acyltransferase PlsY [Agrobacterium larrymoorei]QCI98185.1 glycerol-3-phosphate acyltransferase [Agrobacterium larrymoorei]QYA06361.1 glycerol-3-phosphate acyltransferase [Agrobacterium larrymoorei]